MVFFLCKKIEREWTEMAKSKLSYTRSVTDKMAIKGVLSSDCRVITYKDEDDVSREIAVTDCLAPFAGKEIDFSFTEKSSDEFDVETSDNDEEFDSEEFGVTDY